MTTEFLNYAPYILIVLMFLHQYQVFMTPISFAREKEKLLNYIRDNFVSIKTCAIQNTHINESLKLIREDYQDISKKLDNLSDLLLKKLNA